MHCGWYIGIMSDDVQVTFCVHLKLEECVYFPSTSILYLVCQTLIPITFKKWIIKVGRILT
jgi:hypothetical protein